MIIVELVYKKSLDEVNKFLNEHSRFLDKYYSSGIFIASGPKEPRDGGIIIAMTERSTLEELLKHDPFYQNEIAEYMLIEFHPSKCCEQLKPLLNLT